MRNHAYVLPFAVLLACGPSGEPANHASSSSTAGGGPTTASAAPSNTAVASSGASGTASASATASQTAPADRFACEQDTDCWTSCHHGAVSLAWYIEQYPGGEGCEDGCTSKGSQAPKCELDAKTNELGGARSATGGEPSPPRKKHCVAYFNGKPAPECTGRTNDIVLGPGPAHRCAKDSDCRMSCKYGAVNAQWYSYGAKNECKDGCARTADAPRCEQNICVAYRKGTPDPGCTKRNTNPIPE